MRSQPFVFALGGLLAQFVCASAAAQPLLTWQKSPAVTPSPRNSYAMAYDPVRQETVLFGGVGSGCCFDETWLLDENGWRRQNPINRPSARSNMAMAFCAVRGEVILFGGCANAVPCLDDTWAWNGSNWQRLNPPNHPTARVGHAMVDFNPPTRSIILFGGSPDGSTNLGDLWAWDGSASTWNPEPPPPPGLIPRQNHGLAHDAQRGKLVLFGGVGNWGGMTNAAMDETWTWDGSTDGSTSTWIRQMSHPAGVRSSMGFTYDALRGVCVHFGGLTLNGASYVPTDDTSEWDGSAWSAAQPLPPVPSPRVHHDLAYDAQRRCIVLFGGNDGGNSLGETWEYFATSACVAYGQGCPGSAGTAQMSCPATGPVIDSNFCVTAQPIPLARPAWGLLGFSRMWWGPIPLPFPLRFIGMDGCDLLVSIDWTTPVNVSGTTATWCLRIPDSASLIGGKFYQQIFVSDPGVNALGAVVSDALCSTIGAR